MPVTDGLRCHLNESLNRLKAGGFTAAVKKELPWGVQVQVNRQGEACAVNLYHSRKKGASVVRAGGDQSLLEEVCALLTGEAPGTPLLYRGYRTGTDEAGKGDYFGPIVAAAVSCTEEKAAELRRIGAGDSKKLTTAAVRKLYGKITEMDGIVYDVCSLEPLEYNRLFASLKSRGMNSLDIQAMAHGKAIAGVLARAGKTGTLIIDRFCSIERLRPWLPENTGEVKLLTQAEDKEPAVAAASIIARTVYLDSLAIMSGKYGVELRPGAGKNIDAIAGKLARRHGENVLTEAVKLHFSNTLRVTGGLDRD